MNVSTLDLPGWLRYLWEQHALRIDLGLTRITEVAQRLACLQPAPFVITVAGTNGKGSTVALLAALLQEIGVSVGTYTSPHLKDYNERVCINQKPVSDAMLCEAFLRIEQQRKDTPLTYFECGTLAALLCFQQHSLDVVILEVGLGGRLDAVNIVDPDIAIVVSIGLDHQSYLGDDIESIGREKAGIFRKGCPAIYGDQTPVLSVGDVAHAVGANLLQRKHAFDFRIDPETNTWAWKGTNQHQQPIRFEHLPLPNLPIENAACVLQALSVSPWPFTYAMINGLTQASVPGRFQQIPTTNAQGQPVQVILDIAHNPHAAHYFAKRLAQHGVHKLRMVFAIRAEKDAQGVIKALQSQVDEWFLGAVEDENTPFCTTKALCTILSLHSAKAVECANLAMALQHALACSAPGDTIAVSGSCRTVADILDILKG